MEIYCTLVSTLFRRMKNKLWIRTRRLIAAAMPVKSQIGEDIYELKIEPAGNVYSYEHVQISSSRQVAYFHRFERRVTWRSIAAANLNCFGNPTFPEPGGSPGIEAGQIESETEEPIRTHQSPINTSGDGR